MMTKSKTKTVVFIHGAWMTPASWAPFKKYYEAEGFKVLVPTWPYMDKPVEELRNHPDERLGSLGVGEIADHYEKIIRRLSEAPLLVGHSFGGLIVQMLLDRGVGAAGIAIDPAPIAGVIPDFGSLKAALPTLLRFNGWKRPYMISKESFDHSFANTVPQSQRDIEYDRLVVPAPGRIFYQAAASVGTSVHPEKRKQPLLIISGGKDKTVTPALASAAFRKQRHSRSRTDYRIFPKLSHFLIAEPGWEKVAGAGLEWANEVLR